MKHTIILRDTEAATLWRTGRVTIRRPMSRKPTRHVDDWTFDAEAGEIVIYRGKPTKLVESRGRQKRDAGELTPQEIKPQFQPGSILSVREPACYEFDCDGDIGAVCAFKADTQKEHKYSFKCGCEIWEVAGHTGWISANRMPRWASRGFVRVVECVPDVGTMEWVTTLERVAV